MLHRGRQPVKLLGSQLSYLEAQSINIVSTVEEQRSYVVATRPPQERILNQVVHYITMFLQMLLRVCLS